MNKDKFFQNVIPSIPDFKFSNSVAQVFDDMVHRSVPYYEEMQRMIAELAADHCMDNTKVYDLGCSTGTTIIRMDQTISKNITYVGIDDSQSMLDKCAQKLREAHITHPFELYTEDLNINLKISNASVTVLCLTLQFVRPINRHRLLRDIFKGTEPGGVVIIIEKILAEDSSMNRDFIKYYYEMKKRHHYSELEIAQKREALENVLIPYKLSENIKLLEDTGFNCCEVFFKWYNFSGIIAKKL